MLAGLPCMCHNALAAPSNLCSCSKAWVKIPWQSCLLCLLLQAGISLAGPQRTRMQQLMQDNNHYAAAFHAALSDPKQLGTVTLDLPPSKGSISGHAASRLREPRSVSVPLDPGSVSHWLSTQPDERLRRAVMEAAGSTPAANGALLERMLSARREMAAMLGYDSYRYARHMHGLAWRAGQSGRWGQGPVNFKRMGFVHWTKQHCVQDAPL